MSNEATRMYSTCRSYELAGYCDRSLGFRFAAGRMFSLETCREAV